MNTLIGATSIEQLDFRRRIRRTMAFVGALVLVPVSIYEFGREQYQLGFGTVAITVLLLWQVLAPTSRWYGPALVAFGFLPLTTWTIAAAVSSNGVHSTYWAFPVVSIIFFILRWWWAWLAMLIVTSVLAFVAWTELSGAVATRFTVGLVLTALLSAVSVRFTDQYHQALQTRAVTDPLTGLLNRVRLNDDLNATLDVVHATGRSAAVAIFDIDHFKRINDVHGHLVGDRVIVDVARLLGDIRRPDDIVYRMGGEEFLVLLRDGDLATATELADRVRALVDTHHVAGIDLTVSAGVAAACSTDTVVDWLHRADAALYRAKAGGRNRTEPAARDDSPGSFE